MILKHQRNVNTSNLKYFYNSIINTFYNKYKKNEKAGNDECVICVRLQDKVNFYLFLFRYPEMIPVYI